MNNQTDASGRIKMFFLSCASKTTHLILKIILFFVKIALRIAIFAVYAFLVKVALSAMCGSVLILAGKLGVLRFMFLPMSQFLFQSGYLSFVNNCPWVLVVGVAVATAWMLKNILILLKARY